MLIHFVGSIESIPYFLDVLTDLKYSIHAGLKSNKQYFREITQLKITLLFLIGEDYPKRNTSNFRGPFENMYLKNWSRFSITNILLSTIYELLLTIFNDFQRFSTSYSKITHLFDFHI